MSVPSASFGWSCTTAVGSTTIQLELSANRRDEVVITIGNEYLTRALMTRAQASALGAAIQLALLAVPETEDDIDGA